MGSIPIVSTKFSLVRELLRGSNCCGRNVRAHCVPKHPVWDRWSAPGRSVETLRSRRVPLCHSGGEEARSVSIIP